MAFPTTLQNPKADWNGTDQPIGHSTHHNLLATIIIAMQAKIGIDGSVDTNSLDYKIAHALQVIADEVRISSAMAGGGFFVEIPMEVSSHLSVVGGGASLFQLQSSGYGAGKVLISDVNGNADWKSLATADIVTKTGNEFIDGIKTFQKPVYGNYNNTTGGLGIAANGSDHVYYGWYVNLIRKAYMGFAAAGITTLQINNEMTNGDINLVTNGTGQVKVNGVAIPMTGGSGGVDIVSARSFL